MKQHQLLASITLALLWGIGMFIAGHFVVFGNQQDPKSALILLPVASALGCIFLIIVNATNDDN